MSLNEQCYILQNTGEQAVKYLKLHKDWMFQHDPKYMAMKTRVVKGREKIFIVAKSVTWAKSHRKLEFIEGMPKTSEILICEQEWNKIRVNFCKKIFKLF